MFFVKWMFFFQHFHKSLSKNPISVLRKIAIDLLYFWDVYDVSSWEKIWQHAEQMSLYNFIILRKKTPTQLFSCGICETFKNSGDCFWKHVTCYDVIKNYVGYKLAIFNAFLLLSLLLHLSNMRLWQKWAGSRNMCLKWKEVLLMLMVLLRFIAPFLKF